MDELSGFLEGPLARKPTAFRSSFISPWSVRVDVAATLSVVAVARGRTWVVVDDGVPMEVRAGDLAIVRGPAPFVVTDDPERPPEIVVWPGGRWTPSDAPDEMTGLGLRRWGNEDLDQQRWGRERRKATAAFIVGSYEAEGQIADRLLNVLPSQLVVSARDLDSPFVPVLDEQIRNDAPGQVVMVERLLDLLLLTGLRAWFRRPESDTPVWYEAYQDPMVAATLRLLHADPARSWSVESMADEVGGTRTTLARRFTDMTGETPMAYLARWRLDLAADLFWATDFGLAEVCERVGYSTVYSLSTAFKRVHGINPSQHRKAGRARAAARAEALGRLASPSDDGDTSDSDADSGADSDADEA